MILKKSFIIEALLSDFFRRVYVNTREWIDNIHGEKLEIIRSKKYKKFETFIAWVKRYNLFNKSEDFYDQLHELRSLRNNIHIQKSSIDELFLFTNEEKLKAEQICEFIIKYFSENHLRPEWSRCVRNFILPW